MLTVGATYAIESDNENISESTVFTGMPQCISVDVRIMKRFQRIRIEAGKIFICCGAGRAVSVSGGMTSMSSFEHAHIVVFRLPGSHKTPLEAFFLDFEPFDDKSDG